VLALPPEWRQGLRVETWLVTDFRPGDPRLRPWLRAYGLQVQAHSLVCPGRACLRDGRLGVEDIPPLSRRARGALAWVPREQYRCQERVRTLFLPLCLPGEWEDAKAAQAWLGTIARLREQRLVEAAGSPLEALLVERYGSLFHPRALLCSGCLRLSYGYISRPCLPPARRKWFAKRGAPELPDPFARNRLGHQFAHDQLNHPLPKSALKNAATRKAAGAVTWREKAEQERRARRLAAAEAELKRRKEFVDETMAAAAALELSDPLEKKLAALLMAGGTGRARRGSGELTERDRANIAAIKKLLPAVKREAVIRARAEQQRLRRALAKLPTWEKLFLKLGASEKAVRGRSGQRPVKREAVNVKR
jgi:hypothetical protein